MRSDRWSASIGPMGAAFGQVLGNAVGVAISPVPVIALILMLLSSAATRNSIAFLLGWVVGLLALSLAVLAIGFEASDGGEADSGGLLKIGVGAVLLFLGGRQWRTRPAGGEAPEMPTWMAAIDQLSAGRALGAGAFLSSVNPKNLGLTVAAAASISASGLSGGEEVVVAVGYVLLASAVILVLVVGYLVAGARTQPLLAELNDWLTLNNHTVMTVLFVVLGAKVLGDGLSILL